MDISNSALEEFILIVSDHFCVDIKILDFIPFRDKIFGGCGGFVNQKNNNILKMPFENIFEK
jgi:hypothetical protein